jgi:hypothetical protein
MISLYAVISDLITIIHDYFSDFFSDFFSDHDYVGSYVILLSIIYDYFTVSAPGKLECADSNS